VSRFANLVLLLVEEGGKKRRKGREVELDGEESVVFVRSFVPGDRVADCLLFSRLGFVSAIASVLANWSSIFRIINDVGAFSQLPSPPSPPSLQAHFDLLTFLLPHHPSADPFPLLLLPWFTNTAPPPPPPNPSADDSTDEPNAEPDEPIVEPLPRLVRLEMREGQDVE